MLKTDTPRMIRLKNYRPPSHLIEQVHLDFDLHRTATRVRSRMKIEPNPAAADSKGKLRLDGENLALVEVKLDGEILPAKRYRITPQDLTISGLPDKRFTLEITTEINPEANTELQGLYCSRGIYCTQCEAEGFRRITYFLDRPDVLARYTVRVEGDPEEASVLLSNGNPVERGTKGDRHYAVWDDPHPKPSYLFALVGGNLTSFASDFETASGRQASTCRIYVEPGKERPLRLGHGFAQTIDGLGRETRLGCEYDLDVFNIVAVSDFNMGAMENKGLNIFK